MKKHTQGPWVNNFGSISSPSTETDELMAQCICDVGPVIFYDEDGDEHENEEETEANARLIAAAPDLLEALESAIQNFICLGATEDWPQVQQYRAAIAKANGETK